jgi:hypothetical protein
MNTNNSASGACSSSPADQPADQLAENESSPFTPFYAVYGFLRIVRQDTRNDSSFQCLTEDQHAVLLQWIANYKLADVREMLRAPLPDGFEIDCSVTSIWRYKQKYLPLYREALQQRDLFIALHGEQSTPADFAAIHASTIRALRHLLFNLVNDGADAVKIKALFSVLQKFADQQLVERRVELLEQKAAAFDAAKKELENTDVDPKKLALNIRKYFGLQ